MQNWLLLPPIAFLVVFVVMLLQFHGLSVFSITGKAQDGGRRKPYACGEDVPDHRVQPDYSQFFPFAFFFTIMHVVALVVTTVPTGSMPGVALAAVYMVAAAVGLFILFRR